MTDTTHVQTSADLLIQALPHMLHYDEATIVVKYGGHAMGDEHMARAFARDMVFEEGRGRQKLDPGRGEFGGHRTKKRFSIPFFQAGEKDECAEVRAQVEKIPRRDLAGHQRLGGTGFFCGGDQLAELPDLHAKDFVRKQLHFRQGLPLECGQRHPPHAGGARGLNHQARVVAAPGNQE